MKKISLLLLALICSVTTTWADDNFTWKGGETVSPALWTLESSWTLNGSATYSNWGTENAGPGTATNTANNWSPIIVSGVTSGTTPTLEGWNLRMVADASTFTVGGLNKIQTGDGATCYFTVSNGSNLTVNSNTSGHMYNFDVNLGTGTGNTYTFNMQANYTGTITANYGTVSTDMNRLIKLQSSESNTTRTLTGLTITATLDEIESTTVATLHSVKIGNVSSDVTVTNLTLTNTQGYNVSTEVLTATEANIAKCSVVKDATSGDLTLYWVTGPTTKYTVKYLMNGIDESVWSQSTEVLSGASYPAITTALPYGVSATVPEGTVTEDVTETLDWTFSLFKYAASADAISQWYGMDIHGSEHYYPVYGSTAPAVIYSNTAQGVYCYGHVPNDTYKWGFIGDPFNGFKIYNKSAQKSILQSSDDKDARENVTFDETGSTFKVYKQTSDIVANSFCFKIDGNKTYLNHNSTAISCWDAADGGSGFRVYAADYDPTTTLTGSHYVKVADSYIATSATAAMETGADAAAMHTSTKEPVTFTYNEDKGAYTITDKYGNNIVYTATTDGGDHVTVVSSSDATDSNKWWFITSNIGGTTGYDACPFTAQVSTSSSAWNRSGNYNSEGANTKLGLWTTNGGNTYFTTEDDTYTINYVDNDVTVYTESVTVDAGAAAPTPKTHFGWTNGTTSTEDYTITVPMTDNLAGKYFAMKSASGTYLLLDTEDNAGTESNTSTAAQYNDNRTYFIISHSGTNNAAYTFQDASNSEHYIGVATGNYTWNVSNMASADWDITVSDDSYVISQTGKTKDHYLGNSKLGTAAGIGVYTDQGSAMAWTFVEATKANMRLTSAEWGTFCAPFDVTIPENVKAYTGTVQTSEWVKLNEIETETIPANTAVVVYKQGVGEAESYDFYDVPTDAAGQTSCFTGNTGAVTAVAEGDYILQNNNNIVGWYQVSSETPVTIGKNRCYLEAKNVPNAARASYMMSFDDETTGVNNIATEAATKADGKYLVNGKIVVVKAGKAYNANGTLVK